MLVCRGVSLKFVREVRLETHVPIICVKVIIEKVEGEPSKDVHVV